MTYRGDLRLDLIERSLLRRCGVRRVCVARSEAEELHWRVMRVREVAHGEAKGTLGRRQAANGGEHRMSTDGGATGTDESGARSCGYSAASQRLPSVTTPLPSDSGALRSAGKPPPRIRMDHQIDTALAASAAPPQRLPPRMLRRGLCVALLLLARCATPARPRVSVRPQQSLRAALDALSSCYTKAGADGYWSYELCPRANVTQFHERVRRGKRRNPVYQLGALEEESVHVALDDSSHPVLLLQYRNGSFCRSASGQSLRRSATVEMRCCAPDSAGIQEISEPVPCVYMLHACDSAVCDIDLAPEDLRRLGEPVVTDGRTLGATERREYREEVRTCAGSPLRTCAGSPLLWGRLLPCRGRSWPNHRQGVSARVYPYKQEATNLCLSR
eukprot:scaffold664_cov260-Pinguiococcus_pyrenoidosus.AAC.31